MKLTYFDSRVLGNLSKRGRKPTSHGGEVSITVAPLSGRIYLSTGLVKKFILDIHRFGLALDESGRIYFYLDDEHGFRLQAHQHSYSIQSRSTVETILTEVNIDDRRTVIFKVADKAKKINGKSLYLLTDSMNLGQNIIK